MERLSELFCAVSYTTIVPNYMHTHMCSSYRLVCCRLVCWFTRLVSFSVFFISRFVYHIVSYFVFYVLFGCSLVVSTSTIDCLERLVSEMTCYVSRWTLNSTHSLTLSNRLIRVLCKTAKQNIRTCIFITAPVPLQILYKLNSVF